MKHGLTILVFCLLAFRPGDIRPALAPVWVVERGSVLYVEGSSNVNRFTCHMMQYLHSDTLRWSRDPGTNRMLFRNSAIHIDVQQFDCHHKYITADFRKTLKAGQYPYMRIQLLTLEDLTYVQEGKTVSGMVNITLAGVTRQMPMEYRVVHEQGNRVRLCGSKTMRFSDFQLVPPSKLAGMIKINEAINVKFELLFRPCEAASSSVK